jgi:hypothetical protein
MGARGGVEYKAHVQPGMAEALHPDDKEMKSVKSGSQPFVVTGQTPESCCPGKTSPPLSAAQQPYARFRSEHELNCTPIPNS